MHVNSCELGPSVSSFRFYSLGKEIGFWGLVLGLLDAKGMYLQACTA